MTLLLLLAVLGATALPAPALAVAPVNDSSGNPTELSPDYATSAAPISPSCFGSSSCSISASTSLGGWDDATSTDDGSVVAPTCFGSASFHSMWYRLDVPESGVLSVSLSSQDVKYYQPLVTIINSTKSVEAACSLGGAALLPGQAVVASTYVAKGPYLIRIASTVDNPNDDNILPILPTLQLTETIRDITPPTIHVAVSKIVGVGKAFTLNAKGSADGGSGIDPASALWVFYNGGSTFTVSDILLLKHAWGSAGLHRVSLQLADLAGNKNTYRFNVFVHSFVPPKVSIRVLAPRRGARTLSIRLTHDMPVRVRLVVLQAGRKLRTIPSQTIKGSKTTTTIPIVLLGKIAKTGSVIVSGTASDLSNPPNTVALPTCSVRPGHAGGVCA